MLLSKEEIQAMSVEDVLQALLIRKDCTQLIRNDINERLICAGTTRLYDLVKRTLSDHNWSQPQPQSDPQVQNQTPRAGLPDLREQINGYLSGTITHSSMFGLIRETTWNRIDPSGMMEKTPAEVDDLLEELSWEVGFYPELPETSYKRLLRMVVHAYNRAFRDQQ